MGCRGDPPYCDIMAMHPGVTGSGNLGVVKLPDGRTKKFLVDFGLFQEKEYRELNDIIRFKAKEIEFCIVTHNHLDHIGRIPFLIRKGLERKIYVSKATKELAKISLQDNYRVYANESKKLKKTIQFSYEDVQMALSLMCVCEYNETFWVDENIKITFLENGHMVGASMVLIQICYPGYKEINLLFTGDYNYKNVFFDINEIPKWVLKLPLTIIQEATYGTTDSCDIVENFETNVVSCINNGGTVLCPVFAQDRAQKVLYELKRMQQTGKFTSKIPIYLDGNLAQKYTYAYLHKSLGIKEEARHFLPNNFNYVDKSFRRYLFNSKSKIILATSGMGTFGPIQDYIKHYILDKNSLIQSTGYAVKDSVMRNLYETEYGDCIKVGGEHFSKYAKVEYTNQFSGHIKADEIILFLKQFNIVGVLLNHGELDVKRSLQARISKDGTKVGILGNGSFFRVYSDSFKEYESKW